MCVSVRACKYVVCLYMYVCVCICTGFIQEFHIGGEIQMPRLYLLISTSAMAADIKLSCKWFATEIEISVIVHCRF